MSKTPYQYINLVGKNLKSGIDKNSVTLAKKINKYANVAEMKADTSLKSGDICKTAGYYEANDGGGGNYQIFSERYDSFLQSNVSEDGGYVHALSNGLYARLLINESVIIPEQFGAKGYYQSQVNTVSINKLFDSTNAFKAIVSLNAYTAINKGTYTILLRGRTYFVHELDFDNSMLIRGNNSYTSRLIYNGSGGEGSYIIKANSAATGGLENVSLFGCHKVDGEACEYGYMCEDGVDWGGVFENVNFKYFLKGAMKLGGVNIHAQHMRFDACNEFAIELSSFASFSLKDFTMDYVIRENDNFLAKCATINGASSKCGYGFVVVQRDRDTNVTGSMVFDSARIEGQTWLRPYGGTYSHFRIRTNSSTGNLQLRSLEGGANADALKTAQINLVEFLNKSIGVQMIGCVGTYYNTSVLYSEVEKTRNNSYTRLGTLKQMEIHSPGPKNGTGAYRLSNGILLDGKSFGISQNLEHTYDYYKFGDILFRQLDMEASNNNLSSLGWVCTYPTIGSGWHAPSSANTPIAISTIVNTNTITNRLLVGGSYTVTYSDGTTQVLMVTKRDEETGITTFNNNFTKTDSSASIAMTLCKWTEFGKIGEPDVLISPNGTKYKLTVANDGTLSTTAQS